MGFGVIGKELWSKKGEPKLRLYNLDDSKILPFMPVLVWLVGAGARGAKADDAERRNFRLFREGYFATIHWKSHFHFGDIQ